MAFVAPTAHSEGLAPALDETCETLLRQGDTINHAIRGTLSWSQDAMTAAAKSEAETSRWLEALGTTYMRLYREAATTTIALSQRALACRSLSDVAALQTCGLQAFGDLVETSAAFYNEGFAAYANALEPLMTAAGQTPTRLFQAIAD